MFVYGILMTTFTKLGLDICPVSFTDLLRLLIGQVFNVPDLYIKEY